MIREKKTKKEVSGNMAFLVVIALSIGIIILSSLVGYIENSFGIEGLEYIIYAIIFVAAYFLIKTYLTEYRYSFFDNELIIEKILGKRVTQIASIKSREIEYFGKISGTDWDENELQVDYCDVNKRNAYAIKYIKGGITKVLTLNPSKELILHIQKSIETKDYDELDEDKIIR